ncbi:MAG TPA: tetratricopeptide repeat protein [Gammaproteobacteria bacterium]
MLLVALAAVIDGYVFDRAPAAQSIAVLPLANYSGDPQQDYFADGMTDALITSLAKISALRVVSRRSVMRYRNSDASLRQIASELGVRAALSGSAMLDNGRVRITAQLVDAIDDVHLWADGYERDVEDVLALQTSVALDIARQVAVAITPDEERRLSATRRVDPETYAAYLRGMYYLNRSRPEDVETGLRLLHEAVNRDPADPLAYAGLARGYATVSHGANPAPDAWQRAQAAALRALALDPELPEACAALADVKLYYEWDLPGAERAFQRALELNPGLAMSHYHYAWYLALIGRLDEAIAEHTRARDLDPLTPLHSAWLGSLYLYRGDYDLALEAA